MGKSDTKCNGRKKKDTRKEKERRTIDSREFMGTRWTGKHRQEERKEANRKQRKGRDEKATRNAKGRKEDKKGK